MTNAVAAKYGRIFAVGLQNTVIYRGNFLLRAAFGIVPLVATVFIWRAVFDADGGGERGGYTLPAAVNYFLLVILAESLITPTEDEWQIAADIRDGHLNALLSKPLNYFGYRTCLFFSSRVAYTVITLPITAGLFWWFGSFAHLPGPKTRGEALWRGLAIQAGWVLVAWAAGRVLWARGLRRYGAVGG